MIIKFMMKNFMLRYGFKEFWLLNKDQFNYFLQTIEYLITFTKEQSTHMMANKSFQSNVPVKQMCLIILKGHHQLSPFLSPSQKAQFFVNSTLSFQFKQDSFQYIRLKQPSRLDGPQVLSSIRVFTIESNCEAKYRQTQKTCKMARKYQIRLPELESLLCKQAEKIINWDFKTTTFHQQLPHILQAVISTKDTLYLIRKRFKLLCEQGQVADTGLDIQYLDTKAFESQRQDRKQLQNIIDKTIQTGKLILAINKKGLNKIFFFYIKSFGKLLDKKIINQQRFDLLIEAIFFLFRYLKIYQNTQEQDFQTKLKSQELYQILFQTINDLLSKKKKARKPNIQYIEKNFRLILLQIRKGYQSKMKDEEELQKLLTIERRLREYKDFVHNWKIGKIIDRITAIKKDLWIAVYQFIVQKTMSMSLICCNSDSLFVIPPHKQQFEINQNQTNIIQLLQAINYQFKEDNLEIGSLESFFKSHIQNLRQIIQHIEITSVKDRDFLKIKCLYGFSSYIQKKKAQECVDKKSMSKLYHALRQKLQKIAGFVQRNKADLKEEDLLQINWHRMESKGLSTSSSSENDNFNVVNISNNLAPENNRTQPMNNPNTHS